MNLEWKTKKQLEWLLNTRICRLDKIENEGLSRSKNRWASAGAMNRDLASIFRRKCEIKFEIEKIEDALQLLIL